jgi:hypothetical protein
MNSVIFALMIVTSNGVQEAHTFLSLKECQTISSKLKVDSFCVQKQNVDVEKQMSMMIQMLGKMKRQMDEEFAKNN